MKATCRAILCFLLLLPTAHAAAEGAIYIVVNKGAKVEKLDDSELRNIFMTKRTQWDDGQDVIALNLPTSDTTRQGFDAAILGLDPDRVQRYWIDRKIRGGNRAPAEAPSAAIILKAVSQSPNAIGYVEAAQAPSNVKVVARIVEGQVLAP